MGKKLFVGNLPYSADDGALQALFSSHGNVESARVIVDRETGRSKGFGFVEMSTDEEAQKAMALDGADMQGRAIRVTEARPQEPRRNGNGRGFGGGGRAGNRGGF